MMPTNNLPPLFVETVGQGDPIVLVHGGASSHRYWQRLASLLVSSHRIIMPDLLGWGDSPKPADCQYTLDDQVAALEEALKKQGIKGKYRLLGHSIGALVAVGMAKRNPQSVKQLVLSAPEIFTTKASARRLVGRAVAVPNWVLFGPLAWFSCQVFCRTKVLPRLIARLLFRSLPPAATNDVASHTWKSFSRTRDNLILNQTALADLAALTMPVEILIGQKDPSLEPAAIEQIRRLVDQKPNIRLHIFPSGHNLPYSQTKVLVSLLGNPT